LREIRKLNPHLTDVNVTLARSLAETHEADLYNPAEGAVLAQKTIDNQGEELIDAWETLGICLAELRRYDEAATKLDRALELALERGNATKCAALRAKRSEMLSPVNLED
jgi:tetratricopeptide (TPR) repeat protein